MKLVLLMYLEEDEECVTRLLKEHGVSTFSGLRVDGHGPGGTAGWYGATPPYRSRMVVAVVTEEHARSLVDGVAGCRGLVDPRHPVHAAVLDVERFVNCGLTENNAVEGGES